MNVWKLRLSMLTTLTLIIGISTAFFAVLLGYLGSLNVVSLVSLVARAADILRIARRGSTKPHALGHVMVI